MTDLSKAAIFSIAIRYLKVSEIATREVIFTYTMLMVLAVGNMLMFWGDIFPKTLVIMILINIWLYVRAIRDAKNYVFRAEEIEATEV